MSCTVTWSSRKNCAVILQTFGQEYFGGNKLTMTQHCTERVLETYWLVRRKFLTILTAVAHVFLSAAAERFWLYFNALFRLLLACFLCGCYKPTHSLFRGSSLFVQQWMPCIESPYCSSLLIPRPELEDILEAEKKLGKTVWKTQKQFYVSLPSSRHVILLVLMQFCTLLIKSNQLQQNT